MKEKKTTTLCPSCGADSGDCSCGLTPIVTRHQEGLRSGEVEIVSIHAQDPNTPGYILHAHSVIKHEDKVVEQYYLDNLVTTIGPFVGPAGEDTFDRVIASLRDKAQSILKALPENDEDK